MNPSVPFWGGPTTSAAGASSFGDRVYTYSNSSFRAGGRALMPKHGVNSGPVHDTVGETLGFDSQESAWTHYIHTVPPGFFGDSGSPVLDARGRALGILSTVSLPMDGSSGISDYSRAIRYMRAWTNLDAIRLAPGTEAFFPLL